MGERKKHLKRPLLGALAAVAGILALAASTDPTERVTLSLVFFGLLLAFLVSIGHILAYLRWGKITPVGRARVLIVSSLMVVGFMLKSSGSLNPLEVLVLVLIGVGLWFYAGRRG